MNCVRGFFQPHNKNLNNYLLIYFCSTHKAKMTTLTIDMLKRAFWASVESAPDYDDEKQYIMPDFKDDCAEGEDEKILLKYANLAIKHGIFKVAHGDAFIWLHEGYRNQNLRFYDKDQGVIYPWSDGPDDYGTVPYQFKVGDFPPDKWSNMVDHNDYVFLREDLVEQLKATLKEVKPDIWETTLEILGVTYPVTLTIERSGETKDEVILLDELEYLDMAHFTSAETVAKYNQWAKESPTFKGFADANAQHATGYFTIECYV